MENTILEQLTRKAEEAKAEGKNTVIVFSNQRALEVYQRDGEQFTAEHFNQLVKQKSPLFPLSLEEIEDLQQENICKNLFLKGLLLELDVNQVKYKLIER